MIRTEMIADRFAVDNGSKCAAEVAHMITAIAPVDDEMVAREPERGGIIKDKVWLPQRRRFSGNRTPTNNEWQIAEHEWGVELTL